MDTPPPDFSDSPDGDAGSPAPRSTPAPAADSASDGASNDAAPPASLLGWYRFALLLTGHEKTAAAILSNAYQALGERLARLSTPAARRAWMVSRLKKEAGNISSGGAVEPWKAISTLPEPGRTAYALFHALDSDFIDEAELVQLTDCRSSATLAAALASARSRLLPGASLPSDSLLPLHSPWRDDTPAVATAVRSAAETAPEALENQVRLDREWQEKLHAVSLPEGISLDALPTQPHGSQVLFRHPAVIAVAFAVIVMLGAVVFVAKERMDEFPGKAMVITLVEESTEAGRQILEPIEPVALERLADWFLLKGFDDYRAPSELRHAQAEACRVFRHNGVAVAHVVLIPRHAELFIYRSDQSKPHVESREWITFQQDDWAVATRSEGNTTYVVAVPGDIADLPRFLKEGK